MRKKNGKKIQREGKAKESEKMGDKESKYNEKYQARLCHQIHL
jgi:hypothetical protein